MPEQTGRKSGGSRKVGRNAAKCKRYRDEHRREKNKRRTALRLEKKFAKRKAKKEADSRSGISTVS